MKIKFFTILLIFICYIKNMPWNANTSKDSDKTKNTNHINGKIGDIRLTDININGKEDQIPFYEVPEDTNSNPLLSTVFLSIMPSFLKTYIKKITIIKNNDYIKDGLSPYEFKFNNKKWVKVMIQFSTSDIRIFLLDPNTKIFAKDLDLGILYKYEIIALSERELTIDDPILEENLDCEQKKIENICKTLKNKKDKTK
jgi:hypothetical protein